MDTCLASPMTCPADPLALADRVRGADEAHRGLARRGVPVGAEAARRGAKSGKRFSTAARVRRGGLHALRSLYYASIQGRGEFVRLAGKAGRGITWTWRASRARAAGVPQ